MESQEAELALAAEFEGFTNFTDTVPLVDPVTLSAKIGRQVYDPETGTYRVGETITMNGMYNLLKGRYNRFDIQAAAAEDIKSLGKYTTVVMDGEVKTRENWQDDPLYKKELEAKIDVHFSNPQNITSVLTNAMDSGYSTTGLLDNVLDREGNVDEKKVFWVTNPAQASAGAKTPLISLDIELDKNGNIVGRSDAELDDIFGENVTDAQRSALVRAANKQREEATDFMKTYYTAQVDLIETPQAERAPSQPSAAEKAGLKKTEIGVTNLQKIWGATTLDELRQAIGYFEGLSPNDLKLTVDEIDGVRKLGIKKGDAETKFFDITEDYDGFVEAVSTELLGDVTYVDEAKRLSPLDREKYPTLGTAIGSGQRQRVLDPERIGEERVTVGETTSNVEELLSTITPVSSGMLYGRAIGEGEAEADGKMQEAVFKVGRVLEDLQVGPGVQVRGITVEDSGGSFPQVVITVDGEDRVFTMDEGGTPEMVNYVLESIAKVSSQPKKAELD
jgi:hypothetical protein